MNTFYQKLPLFIELFFSGVFIAAHTISISSKPAPFLSKELFISIKNIFVYFIPFVVLSGAVINYKFNCRSLEDFFRRYIFTLVVLIPLFLTFGDTEFTYWLSIVHLFSAILSLYDTNPHRRKLPLKRKSKFNFRFIQKIQFKPTQTVIISFIGLILIGSLLLSLPISSMQGKSIKFVDALFMATSATCVTGLSTLSLVDNFSSFGQIVILILIQIGGLGFMTLSSTMTILLGKSFAKKDQLVMQNILDISSLEELYSMITDIVRFTFLIELVGGILLTFAFYLENYDFGQSLYYGFFHSISAFCNAGFALFNTSLENFKHNGLINSVVCVLIILGGIGFIVIKEIKLMIYRKRKVRDMSTHTKIVLFTNLILIIVGAIYVFFSEFLNGLEGMSFGNKFMVSIFQSITTRTAGFNTIPLSNLNPHTIYLMTLLMFIGASPGSTGGGIKTSTLAILVQSLKATLKGKSKVEFFERTISNNLVVRATAIIIISLMIVSSYILLMVRLESNHSFLSIFFEVTSAFATVGLSLGITPYLSVAGKVAIASLMFIGRVGPLTIALAIGKSEKSSGKISYPEGKVMIG